MGDDRTVICFKQRLHRARGHNIENTHVVTKEKKKLNYITWVIDGPQWLNPMSGNSKSERATVSNTGLRIISREWIGNGELEDINSQERG